MPLTQCWRWYGPDDPVSLQDIRQTGATAVVTALHHIAHGQIWSRTEIAARKKLIAAAGLTWLVVESLPVHEAIKTDNTEAEKFVANYCLSLKNLAAEGLLLICYNFMPVLDWTRTDFSRRLSDGSLALAFDLADLALFDIHILKRDSASSAYPEQTVWLAAARASTYSYTQKELLESNILRGIPSEKNPGLKDLRLALKTYQEIGTAGLRNNLVSFLRAIIPVCIDHQIQLTLHPDDPPYPILGLPRIVSTGADLDFLFTRVPEEQNGLCFCTGSLGAGSEDVDSLLQQFGSRVHYIHLRNVRKEAGGNFYESDHLDGDVDMYRIMKQLVGLNTGRLRPLPFRPDHGHQLLDDLKKTTNPGYSAIGRLRGLAELRGLELGIERSLPGV